MCSSLDGSHSLAATSTAAIFAHGTASLPDGRSGSHRSARPKPSPRVKLAKLRDRLLNDAATDPHAAHKTPVAMDFAVLPSRRVAQVHAPITTQRLSKENGDSRHYTSIRSIATGQPLDLPQPGQSEKHKPTLELRNLG